MNKQISPDDRALVRDVCASLTSQRTHSAYIKTRDLAKDQRIIEGLDHEIDQYRPRYVGKILTTVDWAEMWSRHTGTYLIDTDAITESTNASN